MTCAGLTQLVARALGGRGTYEDVLGLPGLSMVLPTFLSEDLADLVLAGSGLEEGFGGLGRRKLNTI